MEGMAVAVFAQQNEVEKASGCAYTERRDVGVKEGNEKREQRQDCGGVGAAFETRLSRGEDRLLDALGVVK
jgi:hypothetical protein